MENIYEMIKINNNLIYFVIYSENEYGKTKSDVFITLTEQFESSVHSTLSTNLSNTKEKQVSPFGSSVVELEMDNVTDLIPLFGNLFLQNMSNKNKKETTKRETYLANIFIVKKFTSNKINQTETKYFGNIGYTVVVPKYSLEKFTNFVNMSVTKKFPFCVNYVFDDMSPFIEFVCSANEYCCVRMKWNLTKLISVPTKFISLLFESNDYENNVTNKNKKSHYKSHKKIIKNIKKIDNI